MVQIDPNLHLKIFSKFTQNEHFNQKEWSFNHLDITLVWFVNQRSAVRFLIF